jgi:hypothetical protein
VSGDTTIGKPTATASVKSIANGLLLPLMRNNSGMDGAVVFAIIFLVILSIHPMIEG